MKAWRRLRQITGACPNLCCCLSFCHSLAYDDTPFIFELDSSCVLTCALQHGLPQVCHSRDVCKARLDFEGPASFTHVLV